MIRTLRLSIIPTDLQYLEMVLNDRDQLAARLGVTVPESYPESADAVPWFRGLMRDDPSLLGWLHFHAIHNEERVLIGDGGFKGKPNPAGLVEIGYSIVPEHRRRGFATEIASGLIEYAFSHPEVMAVTAQTGVSNLGSIKVLEHTGMNIIGEVEDPDEGPMLRWQLNRDEYRA